MRKYFFFDIDGTLTDGKGFFAKIPSSTKEAIRQLKSKGHIVGIATGRPYVSSKHYAQEAGIDYMVCNGGYACYVEGQCVESKGMNREDCQRLIEECLRKNIGFCVATSEHFHFITHDDTFTNSIDQSEFHELLTVDESLVYEELPEIYRILIAMRKGEEGRIEDYGPLVPSRYNTSYVIIEPDDKYQGVLTMLKHVQGDPSDVVVFGDGVNDIKMFEHAAFSIAMGNAVDELKAIADYVTSGCDEDGIQQALRHFHWI